VADTKISDLAALTGANLATTDEFAVVDKSDTTMAASGTDKRMTADELAAGLVELIFPTWTTYTPTWTATSNPAIGNGTLQGGYLQLGSLLILRINLVMGSTTTYGTGSWVFGLPGSLAGVGSNVRQVLTANLFDSSSTTRRSAEGVLGPSGTGFSVYADAGTSSIDSGVPWAWATSDQIVINGMLELA
jgi:hypothetical protein